MRGLLGNHWPLPTWTLQMLSLLEEILWLFLSIRETKAFFQLPFRRNFEATCCLLLIDCLLLSPEFFIIHLSHPHRTAHLHHRGLRLLLMPLGFRLCRF